MAEHQDADLHSHGDRHGHGSRRDYLIGFFAAVVLTAVPFWLVMGRPLSSTTAVAVIIAGLAVVQIMVHVRFFLHLDAKGEGGWTMVSFVFTAILVVLTIGGSIWAMAQMMTNMMPMAPGNMAGMP